MLYNGSKCRMEDRLLKAVSGAQLIQNYGSMAMLLGLKGCSAPYKLVERSIVSIVDDEGMAKPLRKDR